MCLWFKEWGFLMCSKHVQPSWRSHTSFQWGVCFYYFFHPPPIQVLLSFLSLSLMLSQFVLGSWRWLLNLLVLEIQIFLQCWYWWLVLPLVSIPWNTYITLVLKLLLLVASIHSHLCVKESMCVLGCKLSIPKCWAYEASYIATLGLQFLACETEVCG